MHSSTEREGSPHEPAYPERRIHRIHPVHPMSLDSASDSVLRQPDATVAITFVGDDETTPPTIAKLVRRHDGSSTFRVRVVGQNASTLVLVRTVACARWATRAQIIAALNAAKTSERTAPAQAGQPSAGAARSGPTSTASTSRSAMGAGGDRRTGFLHHPASNSERDVERAETKGTR